MSTTANTTAGRSKMTVQRATYRTAVASTAGAGSAASGRSNASKRASGPTSSVASPTTGQAPGTLWEAKEDGVCDTWSGYLSSQYGKGSSSKTRGLQQSNTLNPVAPQLAYINRSSMIATLNTCVAKQNEAWEQLHVQATTDRNTEEARRQQEVTAAGAEGVENMLTATMLQRLLLCCQERWQELLTTRIDEAAACDAQEKEKRQRRKGSKVGSKAGSGVASPTDHDTEGTQTPLPATAAPSLPTVDELYGVLVEGLNDLRTWQYVTETLGVEVDSSGIDSVGLITAFDAHIQALTHWFPSVAPDLKALRGCFHEFDPRHLSAAANKVEALGPSLNVAEVQLDLLLRNGDSVEGVASLLRQSIHPAMRRLVYPRAFRLPLRVTDGRPPFPAEKGMVTNNTSSRTLPTYLTCASKYGRDKVRRRTQHTFSTPLQETRARALQNMAQRDVLINVGDSDKYFIYQDDCDVIDPALVSDRGVPVNGLKAALEQLGRGTEALDAYVVYLRSQEGDLIQQKAPPCGFFPVLGSSLLIAPVGNITGDTVEQYELVSAMFGQLWGRMQGPTPELLQCCFIFEKLITDYAMPATLHATRVLQAPPLRLALEWMLTGFAEALDPYEVLILWDWIAACHVKEMHGRSPLSQPVGLAATGTSRAGSRRGSTTKEDRSPPCALWLLPVMAAALFIYRAPMVLKCCSRLDMEALFVANQHVACRSLLQAFLFTDVITGK